MITHLIILFSCMYMVYNMLSVHFLLLFTHLHKMTIFLFKLQDKNLVMGYN